MDMRKFSGSSFINIDSVREPLRLRIASVGMGQWDKPNIIFETGEKFSVNATNNRILVRAFGADSDDWLGHTIELYEGVGEFNGESKPMVRIRTVTEQSETDFGAKKPADKPPKEKKRGDLDDEIPSKRGGSTRG